MRSFGLFCVLSWCGVVLAQDAAQRAEWNQPRTPFRIVGNLYYVGVAGISSYVLTTPKGAILLDGGLPESAPLIRANLKTVGVPIGNVKIVLNSHAHFDHAGGLAALVRESHGELVASSADAGDLEAGRSVDYGDGPDVAFPAVKVARRISDGDTVTLGNVTLTAHVTPGHTAGCTTWTTTLEEAGRRYDVVFYCSTSAPGYRLVDNRKNPHLVDDYHQTFARLGRLHADIFLAPHPSQFGLDDKLARPRTPNPFVDPTELPRAVADSQRAFDAEVARQTAPRPRP